MKSLETILIKLNYLKSTFIGRENGKYHVCKFTSPADFNCYYLRFINAISCLGEKYVVDYVINLIIFYNYAVRIESVIISFAIWNNNMVY